MGTARAESPAGKMLANSQCLCDEEPQEHMFRSDEEIEAVPTESVRLEWKSTLFGFFY